MNRAGKTLLFNQQAVSDMVRIITATILDDLAEIEPSRIVILGIQSNGLPLAQRIAAGIARKTKAVIPVGKLDISMYRDDIGLRRNLTKLHPTEIPFDLDEQIVLLVDDVLQTGRSIRAALDAVTDYGRPAQIRLAVLIDRGMREFPIRSDYTGSYCDASGKQRVIVEWQEKHGADAVYLEQTPAATEKKHE